MKSRQDLILADDALRAEMRIALWRGWVDGMLMPDYTPIARYRQRIEESWALLKRASWDAITPDAGANGIGESAD